MENSDFKKFTKHSKSKNNVRHNNAVIYTRVSTSMQESNFSLETQLTKCKLCAVSNKLNVVREFGGTYESAKSDDRIHFQEMLNFVKNKKNKIGYIIVYDYSRFSRSGIGGISIVDDLKQNHNIKVIDSSTTSIQDNVSDDTLAWMKLVFANSENQTRRKKIIDGSVRRLESGYWCGVPPKGYTKVDKYTLRFNEEAEFIKKAFEMKSNGKSNTVILKVIRSLGSKITKSRLPKYLADPFYCGIIVNKHLDGRYVEGKHEPLVSKELFLRVNNNEPLSKKYETSKVNEKRPLQGDLNCSCGGVYTGYIKKGRYHYYKCNSCNHNTSVKPIHDSFEDLLSKYTFDKRFINLFKKQLKYTFDYIEKENINNRAELSSKISKHKSDLKTVQLKYATDKLNEEIFQNVSTQIKDDISTLEDELSNITFSLSNYTHYVDNSLEIVNDFRGLWENGDINTKKDIQNILFSNQIEFNPQKEGYRTPKENLVISMMTRVKTKKKARKRGEKPTDSRSVLKAGIEPALRRIGF